MPSDFPWAVREEEGGGEREMQGEVSQRQEVNAAMIPGASS